MVRWLWASGGLPKLLGYQGKVAPRTLNTLVLKSLALSLRKRLTPSHAMGSALDPSMATLPTSRAQRVFAYTVGGEKVGLAGFAEEDLGFQPLSELGAALAAPRWVREATAEGDSYCTH